MDVTAGPSNSQPSTGAGSQIRSRVTVVCAECKRLKLKCDRRTPCSSCLKRDTVPRCTYSAAAAEKIDVQSLHNRMLVLESQVTQLTSGKMKISSHDTDHALLAVGTSGSSVLVPLDDVAGVWLEDLDMGRESGIDLQPAFPGAPSDSEGQPKDYLRPESSPHSHVGSTHSSPHPASISTATSSPLSFCPFSHVSTTTVTPALLALLPSAQQRPALLDVLGSVLRMHPSLNFPHFRARVSAMFADGSSPEEIGIGPPRADHAEKPTLSFFAAAAAGFALALQCTAGPVVSKHTSSPLTSPAMTPTPTYTVPSLLALSSHALDLAEDNGPYDLDFLYALVLRCLCMLHDGMPRVSQAVFANVGKMVNVARMMGLARDPDEFSGATSVKYTLWEAEMRRRMWWDVFYYDLFISDCMGQVPLISDDQHTCRMPADVDEDAFVPNSVVLPQPLDHPSASNFSYFIQKCKLAQLVKSMKKRAYQDPPPPHNASSPALSEPSMDAASQAETEINQYISELPAVFKLDVDADSVDSSTSASPSPSTADRPPPYLIVQRCELVAIANQLVLKLFHPFLRRQNVRPPPTALHSCVDAAHAIIQASRIARGVWQKHGSLAAYPNGGSGPSSGDGTGTGMGTALPSSHGVFYPFARQLFDATIIAAHVVIHAPQSVYAKIALEDVRTALEVLRDPAIATGRGRALSRGGVEGCPSEAVSIVEMMVRKAESAKRNHIPVSVGTKRKHEELDGAVAGGFWLPYVGTGVATESGSSGLHGATCPAGANELTNGLSHGSPRAKLSEKPFAPENQPHHHVSHHRVPSGTRERDKERKYPAVGIRNRVSLGSSADRKSPGGPSRSRPEPLVARQSQQPSGDPGGYGRPAPAPSTPAPSTQAEPARGTTGEFSLSAPYALEDAHMSNMNHSPTSSRFPPHQASHSYSSHSFQSTGVPRPQMYDSSPYGSDSGQQPQTQPQQTFYVPYQPPAQAQPTYSPMNGQGHAHAHAHPHSQQQHHPQVNMTPLMGLLPNQHPMDTSDIPLVAKQEEGADMQDSHSHSTESPFAGTEGWVDPGVTSRFPAQASWDSGPYNF